MGPTPYDSPESRYTYTYTRPRAQQRIVKPTAPASGTRGQYTPPKYVAPKTTVKTSTPSNDSYDYYGEYPSPTNPGAPWNYSGAPRPDTIGITNDLDRLRKERLAAALGALQTQYDLERGGISQQLQTMMNQYRRGIAENTRAQTQAVDAVTTNMAERGIFRSGITAQNTAEALTPLVEQRADLSAMAAIPEGATVQDLIALVGQKEGQAPLGTGIRDLLQQYGLLGQEQVSSEAQAKIEAEMSALEIQLQKILADAGLA